VTASRRVLVIDDDPRIRRLLELALGGRGWEVETSPSGAEGLEAARGLKPDVVLLDLNLPDIDGVELLGRLRSWSSVPVIVLSVRDAEQDVIALLDAGADDYLVKPFHTGVLAARIDAVQRRRAPGGSSPFRSGKLEFDGMSRSVRLDGAELHLTPTEYSVLAELVRYAGRIVTRERLLREIWGPAGESEDVNLRVYIRSLRRKLERDAAAPELITTVTAVGYKLEVLPVPGEGAPGGGGRAPAEEEPC